MLDLVNLLKKIEHIFFISSATCIVCANVSDCRYPSLIITQSGCLAFGGVSKAAASLVLLPSNYATPNIDRLASAIS